MSELETQIRLLIEKYGEKEVRKVISRQTSPKKRSIKKTATEYVSGMSLPANYKERLYILAQRFEKGSFLPRTPDIKNLFQALGANAGSIKARQAAIPAVFKLLGTCPLDHLDKIIHQGLFSGPAALGPIADAIKATGNSRNISESDKLGSTGAGSKSSE